MKVWAVANQKGGVGKTTTAITLGGLFVARKRRTLLVDLDPHGSLTSYFGYDPDEVEGGAYALFQEGPVSPLSLLRRTAFDDLELLPASTALATLDRQLGARGGMGLLVGQALARFARRYEQVLIDCPPMLGVLMVNALAACEHLLIPVQTDFLALKGLERMHHTLGMVRRALNRSVPFTIVPTFFDRRTRASVDSLQQLHERYGERVWGSVIPVDTQFREASRQGAPLSLLQPTARGSRAYGALLAHLLQDQNHPQAGVP